MDAKLATLRSETKQSLMEIRHRLHRKLPNLDSFANDVRMGVSSAVKDAVNELQSAHSDLLRLLAKSAHQDDSRLIPNDTSDLHSNCEELGSLPNGLDINPDGICGGEKLEGPDRASFYHDTLRRICNRLDDMYRSEESTRIYNSKCNLDQVADLINNGACKEALKIIVKNSSSVDDVFKLSAEALERAGGVNLESTEKLRLIDYAGMCAKYATTQNKSITSFVDDVIYEALLDGRMSASDFTDKYEFLEDLDRDIERDQESPNENAKRFLQVLTRILIPVTSVVLKVCAIIGFTVFCVNPLNATFLFASAVMLDTLNEFVKSRMVLDMFGTYLNATSTGECLNEVLSNKYISLVSDALLHEIVLGTITVCHSVSRGSLFKK